MRWIDALNHIGVQAWAYLLVITGGGLWVYCAHSHMDTNTASGIIGAGLALFQAAAKSSTTVVAPNASTQQVSTANPQQPQ